MKRRFTEHELYVVRNEIPIELLIGAKLNIPNKIREGYFRFVCPDCGEFNTSTKAETNLARCFSCEKNFNTIDMVMAVTDLDFVKSVQFLQKFHLQLSSRDNAKDRADPQSCARIDMNPDIRAREQCGGPVPMGNILQNMVGRKPHGTMQSDAPVFNNKHYADRLRKLEEQMRHIALQIEQIYTFLDIKRS